MNAIKNPTKSGTTKNFKQDGLRITDVCVSERKKKEKISLQYKRKNLLLQFYPIGQD